LVSEPRNASNCAASASQNFDIERVGLAVNHLHDGDAAAMDEFDHGRSPAEIETPSGSAATAPA